ncbi:MAG: HAMP domain-containing protein [Burkholderiales bacterium]|nr:HAMP domain-containing protein [Burkholderiales bacterium]
MTIDTVKSRSAGSQQARGPDAQSRSSTLLARLDPRRHLAAAIGWTILAVVPLASLVAGHLAAAGAERATRQDTEQLMLQYTTQVQHGLAMNLQIRLSIVETTADQIAASGDRSPDALRRHLDAVRAQFPEFAWVGVADAGGKVVAATGGIAQGESVAQRLWFAAAHSGPFLGDIHPAVLLAEHVARVPDGQPVRFLNAAAPIRQPDGAVAGVVGAYLSGDWIERLQRSLLISLDTTRPLEVLLLRRDGTVIAGPPGWLGRAVDADDDLTEAGRYIVGRHDAADVADDGLGWSVAVRQRTETALQHVERLRRTVLLTVLVAGILAALAALLLTHWLTRRLDALAAQAQAMRQGLRSDLEAPPGNDEVSRIGAAMAALVAQLQREKAALATLNAELDARVAARTARIERMSDEAKHAAVTRERLRLARDLHDTLAHSLMALLQQIRLVRKLRDQMAPKELAAELGRAEDAAAAGLARARAAITQMRHGTVRESGLAAALRDLLARFGERTGLRASLAAEGPAADLADERSETLYRIVEESLRNVERHARASAVTVTIGAAGSRAVLTVCDDGVGFDPEAPCAGHYGMLGMREQAALIDATLSVSSRPGAGTQIRLEFEP